MRQSVLATILETAAANLRFRDGLQIFEVGKVFELLPGEDLPEEPTRLAIVMSGLRPERHWLAGEGAGLAPSSAQGLDFFDLKGVVDVLLERLHVSGAAYEPAEHPTLQPGRTARLVLGKPSARSEQRVTLGVLGELRPAVREAFGLPDSRVAAAELDLDELLAHVPAVWYVEPVSAFPAVLQDLALVVDEAVPAAVIQEAITQAGGFLLKEARLFDVYRGDPVPAGKKSLAYALAFQAPDKTLRDEIVAKQVQRIVKSLNREFGAELRS
jgi:phenylalanyl-tRNA synthetase beta chain